jgi:hypothetical protein
MGYPAGWDSGSSVVAVVEGQVKELQQPASRSGFVQCFCIQRVTVAQAVVGLLTYFGSHSSRNPAGVAPVRSLATRPRRSGAVHSPCAPAELRSSPCRRDACTACGFPPPQWIGRPSRLLPMIDLPGQKIDLEDKLGGIDAAKTLLLWPRENTKYGKR